MVGRNDPCPCGSGKKYKKCHGKNVNGDITAVVESEFTRLKGVFAQHYYQNFNYKLQPRYQAWSQELQHAPHLPEGYLEYAVADTAMYVDEPADWKQYVEQIQADDSIREQVKAVFAEAAEAKFALAEVTGSDENVLNLQNVATGEAYVMPISENAKTAKWVFGVIFNDSRVGENGISVAQSTLFIPEALSMVTDIMKAKIENGETDALELYKAFVEILENDTTDAPVEAKEVTATEEAIVEEDGDADAGEPVEAEEIVEVEEATEEQTFEQEIAALVKAYLTEYNLDATDFVKSVDAYLAETDIKAKKAGAVAAGAILAGQTAGVVPEGGLSKVKDVAEHFDVSSSSLSKYRKEIAEYLAK